MLAPSGGGLILYQAYGYEEEYVRTLEKYESTDDEYEHVDEEVYEELYKDVNVRLKDVEQGEEGKGDAEKTDVDNALPTDNKIIFMMNVDVRHEEPSKQTPSLLTILVTVIPETLTAATTTVPPSIPLITHLPQLSTPTLTPTIEATKTLILDLLDFSSVFQFNQRVSNLEKELSQLKQADQFA
nr:hypothetical protein [Tanacetum cinerariifolium]